MPRLFTWARPGRRGRAGAVLLVGLAVLVSACGVGSAVVAPLSVLKASDTVVETNLQTVQTALQLGQPATSSGIATTPGSSTGYSVVSVSAAAGQSTVLAGFNQLSDNCLGLLYITAAGIPVLGQSQPGSYYFWITGTTSAGCDGASFAATPNVPAGWPSGDPSGSGWPLP